MSKRFRECSLDQPFLLPPSLQDWLPEDHLARFIAEMAGTLDLGEIYAQYERKDGRGLAAYHPLMLTRLLLYAYATGRASSRQIEQATHDDVAFRYLAADQHPITTPSRSSGSSTWSRWRGCSCRPCECASGAGEAG